MQSCDFSGGAWFRTTNEEEEHAFYDPDTNQLYKNNGNIATRKLVSVQTAEEATTSQCFGIHLTITSY
jgi:hypothetical protein